MKVLSCIYGLVGGLYQTKGVSDLANEIQGFSNFINKSLDKFFDKDWGTICDEDKQENEYALEDGGMILGVYQHESGKKIWIIADAQSEENFRQAITVLLPDEY